MNFETIKWNKKTYDDLVTYLYTFKDEKYKEFNDKLSLSKYNTIGVRLPILRNISKKLSKTNFYDLFKHTKDSNIYEVIFIEGILYSYIKDFTLLSKLLISYSKRIDSWAFTDSVVASLKIFKKYKKDGLKLVNKLINSNDTFSKRMGYVILLDYYVEKDYLELIFVFILNEKNDNYYIKMAIAWLLSVMYIKYKDEVYIFLKEYKDDFIKKKAVNKICDSYRVSDYDKLEAKKLLY